MAEAQNKEIATMPDPCGFIEAATYMLATSWLSLGDTCQQSSLVLRLTQHITFFSTTTGECEGC